MRDHLEDLLGEDKAFTQAYKLFREKIVHEDNLISQRSTWFATLQSVLAAAGAIWGAVYAENIGLWDQDAHHSWALLALSIVGLTLSIATFVSVQAAHKATRFTDARWEAFCSLYSDYSAAYREAINLPVSYLGSGMNLERQHFFPAPSLIGAGNESRARINGGLASKVLAVVFGLLWFVAFVALMVLNFGCLAAIAATALLALVGITAVGKGPFARVWRCLFDAEWHEPKGSSGK